MRAAPQSFHAFVLHSRFRTGSFLARYLVPQNIYEIARSQQMGANLVEKLFNRCNVNKSAQP